MDDAVFTEARAVAEWADIWHIWFSPAHIESEGHYWPVLYSTFWVEHKLWGFDPAGYHAVNVLLHLVVTRGSGVAVGVVGGLVGPFEGFGSGVVVVDVVEDGCGEVAGVSELGGVEELAGED